MKQSSLIIYYLIGGGRKFILCHGFKLAEFAHINFCACGIFFVPYRPTLNQLQPKFSVFIIQTVHLIGFSARDAFCNCNYHTTCPPTSRYSLWEKTTQSIYIVLNHGAQSTQTKAESSRRPKRGYSECSREFSAIFLVPALAYA